MTETLHLLGASTYLKEQARADVLYYASVR